MSFSNPEQDYMRIPESLRYRKMFEDILLPTVERPEGVKQILSVACGKGLEASMLLDLFPNADYVGIDIQAKEFDVAKMINLNHPRASFVIGDAREQTTFADKTADLLVIRNPRVLEPKDEWGIIFANSIKALRSSGHLYVSTGHPREHSVVKKYLADENIDIVKEVTAESGRSDPDRFIIVGVRQ